MTRYLTAIWLIVITLAGCSMIDLSANPNFQAQLDDGGKPATIVHVQEDIVEAEKTLEVDWAANTAESNVDYTSSPPNAGDVILQQEVISDEENLNGNTWSILATRPTCPGIPVGRNFHWQSFKQTVGHSLKLDIVKSYFKKNLADVDGNVSCKVYNSAKTQVLGIVSAIDIFSTTGEWLSFDFSSQSIDMADNTQYWLYFEGVTDCSPFFAAFIYQYYQNTDVYANGQFDRTGSQTGTNLGDLAFEIIFTTATGNYYSSSGYLTTDNFDLGSTPTVPGEWQAQDTKPDGTSLTYEAWSSSTNLYDVEVPLNNNQGNAIGNLAWNSTPGVTVWNQNWQSFQHSSYQTGKLGEVSGRFFKNFTGTRTVYCELWSASKGALIGVAVSASLTAVGVNQDLTFDFSAQGLNVESDTEYWLKFYDSAVISNDAYYVAQRYQNSDVFSAGQFDRTGNTPGTNLGDLRFTIIVKVWGNYLGTFQDGDPITTLTQYYRARADFTANTNRDKTTTLHSIKADFSTYKTFTDSQRIGQENNYEMGLMPISGISSEISDFKESTIGQITPVIDFNESISKYLYGKYPKNKIVKVLIGFDDPAFPVSDFLEFFRGQVVDYNITSDDKVSLITQAFQVEWNKKVPETWEDISDDVTWDDIHPIDVMLDIIRNYMTVRDSKIVASSFAEVKALIPSFTVTRTITKNPVEAKKLMEELRLLTGSYFLPRSDGKIKIKRFDPSEAVVATLTDANTKDMGGYKGNLKTLINKTLVYFAHDGEGDDAADYAALAIDVTTGADSHDNWGEWKTKEVKDKWTLEEDIAQVVSMSDVQLARYKNPPAILQRVGDKKLLYIEAGDMVAVTTKRAPSADGVSGIVDKKFQVIKPSLDFKGDKVTLTLLEA